MKKYFKLSAFILSSAIVLYSCKKNNIAIDQDPIIAKPVAKFNRPDSIATYYIKSTGEPFLLPIGVTNVSDKDRVVTFAYSSRTAVAGQQYNAPASITIKAGAALDTLRIQGLYAGFASASRIDTLLITITGGDVGVPLGYTAPRKGQFRLILRKYCDVNIQSFLGAYANTKDGTYGPYTTTVTSAVQTGPTTGYLIIKNIWDPGVPVSTRVDLDWANPANFLATIANQSFDPAAPWNIVQYPSATGTFSSCDQTFTLRYNLTNSTTGAVVYSNQTTSMRR